MIMNKKFLTIGRHGAYDFMSSMPLFDYSMVEAFYRGKQLKTLIGSLDKVFSSPMPRAKITAFLNAIGADLDEKQVSIADRLVEFASENSLRIFWTTLEEECKNFDLNHVHLVTHLPVIDTLSHLFFKPSYFLAPGECLVLSAESWQQIFDGNLEVSKLPNFDPNILSIYQSRLFGTKRKDINKLFDGEKNINPEEVFDYLDKLGHLSGPFVLKDVCDLFKSK